MTDPQPMLTPPSPEQVRAEFVEMLRRDWLGPAGGEAERIDDRRMRDRYLIGALAPKEKLQSTGLDAPDEDEDDPAPEGYVPPDEQGDLAAGGIDDEDGNAEPLVPDVGDTVAFIPSTIGVTVALADDADEVAITVRYGRYERRIDEDTEAKYWQRVPVEVALPSIPVHDGLLQRHFIERDAKGRPIRPVYITGVIRRGMGGYAITLFLVNGQRETAREKDAGWIFQPEIIVRHPRGRAIIAKRPLARTMRDPEGRMMEMLYRRTPEFAVGHGVGVHVTPDAGRADRAIAVSTQVLPLHELTLMAPRAVPGLQTDMAALAATPMGDFSAALRPLVDAYAAWLEARQAEVSDPDSLLQPFVGDGTAETTLRAGWRALARIRAGIALLDHDPDAARAFQFANAAMHLQRVRSIFAEGRRRGLDPDFNTIDIPINRTWRPFQLAFILLNLPAMCDPTHPDRSAADPLESPVDLLWFPTGGGKTEAYLGLTAFTLAVRRLQRGMGGFDGDGAGVAVIMRYTLRLLTLQQFQRASALMCACEILRRDDPATWGDEPFRIGLWVGSSSTPNYTEEAARAVTQARNKAYYGGGTPFQLKSCPWCGSEIDPAKNIFVETFEQGAGRTLQFCGDTHGTCPFGHRHGKHEGLPIVVVDEEIYRRLPALIIATVDKFAQMPWKGETQMLFGRVSGRCSRHGYRSPDLPDTDSHPKHGALPAARTIPFRAGLRPPDLIIQDELHLISGPLGTLVGLYETAVDALCGWNLNGVEVRPKIVASTATIRRATQQIHGLFERAIAVFPPSGLDAADNFFAYQDTTKPGRLYLGVCASGTRLKSALIRVYVTVMAAAQKLLDTYGHEAADPYMTLVGYFNSVRELGGMVRVMDDAVQSRLGRMDRRGLAKRRVYADNVQELTSRKRATEIPEILERLETPFTARAKGEKLKTYPLDAVLATNMISVGVDVARLGCMVVAGQPKATAEYIQATSRVGRRAPGVVIAVYNWTRPRDLSHYERFEHYHATFYQQVEALSVTPFAPRALDRALVAVLVALVRLESARLNPDSGAGEVRTDDPQMESAIARIMARVQRVTGRSEALDDAQALLMRHQAMWLRLARTSQLTYKTQRGTTVNLLRAPQDRQSERERFTCLNSMRDVEPPIHLILDDYRMDELPDEPQS